MGHCIEYQVDLQNTTSEIYQQVMYKISELLQVKRASVLVTRVFMTETLSSVLK